MDFSRLHPFLILVKSSCNASFFSIPGRSVSFPKSNTAVFNRKRSLYNFNHAAFYSNNPPKKCNSSPSISNDPLPNFKLPDQNLTGQVTKHSHPLRKYPFQINTRIHSGQNVTRSYFFFGKFRKFSENLGFRTTKGDSRTATSEFRNAT